MADPRLSDDEWDDWWDEDDYDDDEWDDEWDDEEEDDEEDDWDDDEVDDWVEDHRMISAARDPAKPTVPEVLHNIFGLVVEKKEPEPVKFNPTYKRICWHDWIEDSNSRVGNEPVPPLAFDASLALLFSGMAIMSISVLVAPVAWTMMQAGAVGSVAALVAIIFCGYHETGGVSNRICAKCGRTKLSATERQTKLDAKREKLQVIQAAKDATRAEREKLEVEAVAQLRKYADLAKKAV